jgi:hypothetical protein
VSDSGSSAVVDDLVVEQHRNVECECEASLAEAKRQVKLVSAFLRGSTRVRTNAIAGYSTGALKSLLQKIVRAGPLRVDLTHGDPTQSPQMVCARILVGVAFLHCVAHGGYVDNAVHRHISGREAAFGRLAVITLEDSFANVLPLTAMLAIKALTQDHPDWHVPFHWIRRGLLHVMRAQMSTQFVPWRPVDKDSKRGKAMDAAKDQPLEWAPWSTNCTTTLGGGTDLVQQDLDNACALMRKTGGMEGDQRMFRICRWQRKEWGLLLDAPSSPTSGGIKFLQSRSGQQVPPTETMTQQTL